VPRASVVSRDDFTLEIPPTTYPQVTDRKACRTWPPQTVHIDETTAVLALCFAAPEADNIDLRQLVLEWRQPGDSIQISLGNAHLAGTLEIGVSPTPS
jgi:hypothetical protein